MTDQSRDVTILGAPPAAAQDVLSPAALAFLQKLHREFAPRRREVLAGRAERAERLAAGEPLAFLSETADVRAARWRVAAAPPDLDDRRVEITGPAEPKMMINAFNSGASVFMCDLEDALSPTWANSVGGQQAIARAVRRTLAFTSPDGKAYSLGSRLATMVVRPRGWHMVERHVTVGGEPISASLFDFGLCFFHNASQQLARGSGPYYYLPKLEGHLEARLWNDVFCAAQDWLGVPRGSIRATVLIETIPAAFEMDEILYELRDHAAGLNAGRWDYIFSVIKKLGVRPEAPVLPDRAQVTMAVPFMRAYAQLLVRTCHRRGAHAIGGMAAFIPSRRDAAVNEVALARVREDKHREAGDGFDGTWVAHPDLVPVARECFDAVLGASPHQKGVLREDVAIDGPELVDLTIPNGTVTEAGVRTNVSVAIRYLASWLDGVGAAAIDNLMEDAATAEISRAQLWQWIARGVQLDGGAVASADLYRRLRDAELERLGSDGRYGEAAELLDALVLSERFEEFLTLPAYSHLA